MNSRVVVFLWLIFFIFSCKSVPIQTDDLLDWDSDRFEEKDGKLFNAVKSGDSYRVRAALANNPNINVSDRLRQTAFMWACFNGNLDIINILLAHDAANITKKTKNYKRLDIKALSSPKNPELRYNALFCFVMSNGINPYNNDAKDTLKKIIDKDPSILDTTDYYGETVIHKLIRSNNNYFDVVITDNSRKTEREKQELLNKPSRRHSPLRLAVEVGNRWMVEALANSAEKGMTINDFSDNDLPMIAFDYGNGDFEIFLSYFKGKIWDDKKKSSPPNKNNKFIEAYNSVSNTNEVHSQKVTWLFDIYDMYENGTVVNNPNLLASENYIAAKTEIFDLARNEMSEATENSFFAKIKNFPDAVHLFDNIDNKSLIQYIIEYQSVDVLEKVFKNVMLYKLLAPSSGYGDYLTTALLGRKTKQMHFLLDRYPDFQNGIYNLMRPDSRVKEQWAEEIFGWPIMSPLELFCASSLSDDIQLLNKMARFYRPRFYDQTYCGNLIYRLVTTGKYDIFELFLDLNDAFYQINNIMINDNQVEKPVLEILFNNQERLARKIVNYYIRTKNQLDTSNEAVLRLRDSELWRRYQNSKTVKESEEKITPEKKAQ